MLRQTQPLQPPDTSLQPDIRPPLFRDGNPPEAGYHQQHFEDNEMHIDLMDHEGTHYDHHLTPVALATAEVPFQDEIGVLSSTQSQPFLAIPSQGSPLSHLESSVQESLLAAAPTTTNVDGTNEYRHGPTSQPHANLGPHSPALFNAPLPYPIADAIVQEMRRQSHIAPNHEFGSQGQFFPSSSSGDGRARFASPDRMDTGIQDNSSLAPVLADGRPNDPPHHYATLQNRPGSFAIQFPARAWTEPMPKYVPGSWSRPYANAGAETSSYANSNGIIPIRYPVPLGHFYGNMVYDQAPPATMFTTNGRSTVMSSFTSGNENYVPSQQPATWDDSLRPSPSIPTQRDMEPSYGQSLDRTFLPFTSTDSQSSPFAGSGPNTTWDPPSSSPSELQGQPRSNPPTPRQETFASIPTSRDLAQEFPCSSDATDEDDPAVSSPALTDEEPESSSPSPDAHPWTGLNTDARLRSALGPQLLTNGPLIQFLRIIVELPLIEAHELEPTVSSPKGQELINQIRDLPGCPPLPLVTSLQSIFSLFVAYPDFSCLICGTPKQCLARGVGCVRKHLEHRPYLCDGEGGCKSCNKKQAFQRFYTQIALNEHRSKQGKFVKCGYCHKPFKGNLGRHEKSCRDRKLKGNLGRHEKRCRQKFHIRHRKSQKGA